MCTYNNITYIDDEVLIGQQIRNCMGTQFGKIMLTVNLQYMGKFGRVKTLMNGLIGG